MKIQLGTKWRKAIQGTGGMQGLLRTLQAAADSQGVVVVTNPVLVERIHRYRDEYGDGGFQRRIGTVLDERNRT